MNQINKFFVLLCVGNMVIPTQSNAFKISQVINQSNNSASLHYVQNWMTMVTIVPAGRSLDVDIHIPAVERIKTSTFENDKNCLFIMIDDKIFTCTEGVFYSQDGIWLKPYSYQKITCLYEYRNKAKNQKNTPQDFILTIINSSGKITLDII